MQQHRVFGKEALKYLQYLLPADIEALPVGKGTLSVMLNEQGGIVDDLIVTRTTEDKFYLVTNATRRNNDIAHMDYYLDKFPGRVKHELLDKALIALQGPSSADVLQKLTRFDLKQLTFGHASSVPLLNTEAYVTRGGYTGEDGFEISLSQEAAPEIAEALLNYQDEVKLAGLAARDILRLEAGMCLYGHDLDDSTTCKEAMLSWLLPKHRTGYIGRVAMSGDRRRVGIVVPGPAPARGLSSR
jgi:glycine cleavage system T protein (aminomethyltransferase)